MDGILIALVYPWVSLPVIATAWLALSPRRTNGQRLFGVVGVAVAVAGFIATAVWWESGCWDSGIPCEGDAIESITAVLWPTSLAMGLSAAAVLLVSALRSRR